MRAGDRRNTPVSGDLFGSAASGDAAEVAARSAEAAVSIELVCLRSTAACGAGGDAPRADASALSGHKRALSPGASAPPPPKRMRQCSVCRGVGHNKRRCPRLRDAGGPGGSSGGGSSGSSGGGSGGSSGGSSGGGSGGSSGGSSGGGSGGSSADAGSVVTTMFAADDVRIGSRADAYYIRAGTGAGARPVVLRWTDETRVSATEELEVDETIARLRARFVQRAAVHDALGRGRRSRSSSSSAPTPWDRSADGGTHVQPAVLRRLMAAKSVEGVVSESFLSVVDSEIMETMLTCTNHYGRQAPTARQRGQRAWRPYTWRDVSMPELLRALAIVLLLGIRNVSNLHDAWSSDWMRRHECIARIMPRDRFLTILRALHVVEKERGGGFAGHAGADLDAGDSDDEPGGASGAVEPIEAVQREGLGQRDDRDHDAGGGDAGHGDGDAEDGGTATVPPPRDAAAPVVPLMEHLRRAARRVFNVGHTLSFDEFTIPFRGRVTLRRFNPAKPDRYHMKLYMLNDAATGAVIDLRLAGSADADAAESLTDVVLSCVPRYLDGVGRLLACDNYYTSPALFTALFRRGYYAVGTVRANRVGLPPLASASDTAGGNLAAGADDGAQFGSQRAADAARSRVTAALQARREHRGGGRAKKVVYPVAAPADAAGNATGVRGGYVVYRADPPGAPVELPADGAGYGMSGAHSVRNGALDEDLELRYVRWQDRKEVTLLTTLPGDMRRTVVERKMRIDGRMSVVNVPAPAIVPVYNKGMGGTDLAGYLYQLLRTSFATHRWTTRFTTAWLVLCTVNVRAVIHCAASMPAARPTSSPADARHDGPLLRAAQLDAVTLQSHVIQTLLRHADEVAADAERTAARRARRPSGAGAAPAHAGDAGGSPAAARRAGPPPGPAVRRGPGRPPSAPGVGAASGGGAAMPEASPRRPAAQATRILRQSDSVMAQRMQLISNRDRVHSAARFMHPQGEGKDARRRCVWCSATRAGWAPRQRKVTPKTAHYCTGCADYVALCNSVSGRNCFEAWHDASVPTPGGGR